MVLLASHHYKDAIEFKNTGSLQCPRQFSSIFSEELHRFLGLAPEIFFFTLINGRYRVKRIAE